MTLTVNCKRGGGGWGGPYAPWYGSAISWYANHTAEKLVFQLFAGLEYEHVGLVWDLVCAVADLCTKSIPNPLIVPRSILNSAPEFVVIPQPAMQCLHIACESHARGRRGRALSADQPTSIQDWTALIDLRGFVLCQGMAEGS